jgi:DNA-binding transcriptional ArsR family regulator
MYYSAVGSHAIASDAYRAIADPTRRALLDLLAEAERSVGELVAAFSLTQPAISQHLRILVEAGLARVRRAGRQRFYSVDAAPLREVYDWAGHYEQFWPSHLERLGRYLDETVEPEEETQ